MLQKNTAPDFAESFVINLQLECRAEFLNEVLRADTSGFEPLHKIRRANSPADFRSRIAAVRGYCAVASLEIEGHDHSAQIENNALNHAI
jgi:hypothetical protein